MSLAEALATVREAPFIVDVLHAADDLAGAAARDGGRRAVTLLTEAIEDPHDELTAIAAVHALGRVVDDAADALLLELLSNDRWFLRQHASWVLGARLPRVDAAGRLVAVVAAGGFPGMLAQRTLEIWAASAPDQIALALERALALEGPVARADGAGGERARARLTETLGLVPSEAAAATVLRLAADADEAIPVRIAAVSALGSARSDPRALPVVRALARADDGELADYARLAEYDLTAGPPPGRSTGGLVVAQLFLHADIDRAFSQVGAGDNGGIATLLLRLGDALAAEPGVDRVLTLSRGKAADAVAALRREAPDHDLIPVPLPQPPVAAVEAWPTYVAARRGIRRALAAVEAVDVLHLRMADVGSLAAAAAAKELGIPTVFTIAPDPHAMIHQLDMTGALTRDRFGAADERDHLWFRARLVQRLAAEAAHGVLFPRPELDHDLRELLGIDRTAEPQRYSVVPEGIDVTVTDTAAREVSVWKTRKLGTAPARTQLDALLAALAPERLGLPLVISVGRLHRVKGMATVVEAWAGDPALREGCNLLIVGGDLDRPSQDEQEQLDRIASVVPGPARSSAGLMLAGHRSHDVVARWLAVVAEGYGPGVAPGGVYVCGSLKEEFGLAVVEAMAAGLVVVAPDGGGPATYVTDGVDGVLVDTRTPAAVRAGIVAALRLASAPDAAERARRTLSSIRKRFTVQAMADHLADIYHTVAARMADQNGAVTRRRS